MRLPTISARTQYPLKSEEPDIKYRADSVGGVKLGDPFVDLVAQHSISRGDRPAVNRAVRVVATLVPCSFCCRAIAMPSPRHRIRPEKFKEILGIRATFGSMRASTQCRPEFLADSTGG